MITGLVLWYLAILLVHGLVSAAYPYDLNYAEGFVLNDALRLVRGQTVWADITQFPMVRSPYPPLYLVLVGAVSSLAPSFLGARLLSLLATLAIGAMLVWHGLRFGRMLAVAAAGVWFGSTFVYQWAPLARVDLLGVALSVAAVLVLADREIRGADPSAHAAEPITHPSSRRLLVAALLCGLALLTKQTLIAAPLAIAVYLAGRRDWRVSWFVLAVAGIVGLVTLALNLTTDGQYVRHVLLGNATNPFRWDRAVEMSAMFFALHGFAAVLAAAAVAAAWRRRTPGVLAWYVPTALLTVFSTGNVSGDVNYFLEPIAALALALPLVRPVLPSPLVAALVLAQLAILMHVPNGFMSQYPPGPAKGATPVAEDVRIGDRVLEAVRAAGPRSLVEPAGFSVLAGQPVWIQPLDLIAERRQGRWTPGRLVESIERREWDLVVLNYQFWPGEALEALAQAYEQVDGLASPNGFSYFIYRPRR